jgi:hypothetical protein
MTDIAVRHPSGQGLRRPDAIVPMATSALLGLLRRLPAPLADLRGPTDQAALAVATRRGAVRLLLSGGAAVVVRARP